MNNSGTDEEEEEDDEQEEEEEEEDDLFHESLDRILSSSNSSTPASDDDDPLPNNSSNRNPTTNLNKHDWISDAAFSSSSLQQRRDRLLTSLDLSSSDFSRSVSSVHLSRIHPATSPVPRSKSLTSTSTSSRNPDTGDHNAAAEACVIKNLDTGKEFVVNEDGMWKKVREVGTGRQMTMDEFHMCVGHSPIVQELMRRQGVEETSDASNNNNVNQIGGTTKCKKKGSSWFRSIRSAAGLGRKERRISDETERRPVYAVKDGPERVQVRQCGKSGKELSALYKSQEIQAHNGSIWSVRFSLDGEYLASAGEDCMIHVWRVVEAERKGELLTDRLEDARLSEFYLTNGSPRERRRRGRMSVSRNSMSLDHAVIPETVFGLSEKPVCSFQGHLDDVLDLSWSKSQLLLSSSMDKTVRLWNLSSKTCLNIFSHNDYVTCIQFNPVDDRYFISGSLDAKVRIWSIPDRQVVDWNDMHEMVTAACYTPDGQGALVGSYKGSCRLYNTSENKLQPKSRINLQNKKKKSHLKKITGFQFAPGSSSEVLITSADSRVRVVDGVDLVHKFKGFRNTNSQISASITSNGKYVVCASEDSHVYVWKHEGESRAGRSKDVTITRSYEQFHCQDVSVVAPWPGIGGSFELTNPCSRDEPNGSLDNMLDETLTNSHPLTTLDEELSTSNDPFGGTVSSVTNGYLFDRLTTTWPEEKALLARKSHSTRPSLDLSNGVIQNRSAWGLAIVTASLRGKIRTFQNFGLPVRI